MGATILSELINADSGDYRGRSISEGGYIFTFAGYRTKHITTVLGEITVNRAYYYSHESGSGFCPKDRVLDIEDSSLSPGMRRILGRTGANGPFGAGAEDLWEIAGIRVTTKEVERTSENLGEDIGRFFEKQADSAEESPPARSVPTLYICMDGTGVPVVKRETAGRKGKGVDGQAKTREVKLGCVFTQTTLNEEGYPVRDESSTTYTGAIETASEFADRIYREAVRRGADGAGMLCVIGDGAPWIWNIAEVQFPGAIQIVDLYHAREHYWNAARAVFGADTAAMNAWARKRKDELNAGKAGKVIEAIRSLPATTEQDREICLKEAGYFMKNSERMRYDLYRQKGLFVGSGVLEAGCKSVVGKRLKQSGMHWTVRGANSIIALRCCLSSNRWEDYWEERAAA